MVGLPGHGGVRPPLRGLRTSRGRGTRVPVVRRFRRGTRVRAARRFRRGGWVPAARTPRRGGSPRGRTAFRGPRTCRGRPRATPGRGRFLRPPTRWSLPGLTSPPAPNRRPGAGPRAPNGPRPRRAERHLPGTSPRMRWSRPSCRGRPCPSHRSSPLPSRRSATSRDPPDRRGPRRTRPRPSTRPRRRLLHPLHRLLQPTLPPHSGRSRRPGTSPRDPGRAAPGRARRSRPHSPGSGSPPPRRGHAPRQRPVGAGGPGRWARRVPRIR